MSLTIIFVEYFFFEDLREIILSRSFLIYFWSFRRFTITGKMHRRYPSNSSCLNWWYKIMTIFLSVKSIFLIQDFLSKSKSWKTMKITFYNIWRLRRLYYNLIFENRRNIFDTIVFTKFLCKPKQNFVKTIVWNILYERLQCSKIYLIAKQYDLVISLSHRY